MDDVLKFVGIMMGLVATGLVGYAGIAAINAFQRRVDRNGPPAGLNPDEVELLRAQLVETEQLRQRVGELEERADFAERLLGQVGEQRGVGPGRN